MNEKYIGSNFNDFMEEMEIEEAYAEYLEEQASLRGWEVEELKRWFSWLEKEFLSSPEK